jgi:hypothetical protein
LRKKDVDGREEPGHDEKKRILFKPNSSQAISRSAPSGMLTVPAMAYPAWLE